MPNIKDANISSIRLAEQVSDPATPAAGFWRLYMKAAGLYIVDDAGTVSGPFSPTTAASNSFLSMGDEFYPDRDVVDEDFYSTPDAATYTFTAIATPVTYGQQRVNIAGTFTGTRTVESGWFPIEPSTEYSVRGNATMSTSNDIDVALYFETGSLDAAGVVTPLTQTLIDSRSNTGSTTIATVNVTTDASARRARFVMERIDDTGVATASARFGGFSVRRVLALSSLSDIDLTGLADGDTLVWDNASSTWIPGAGGGGGGGLTQAQVLARTLGA